MQTISKPGFFGRALQRGARVASLFASGRSKLFAFDELMSVEALEAAKVSSTHSVIGAVEGYTLASAAPSGEPGVGELTLVRQPGKKVYGMIHDVSNVEVLLLEALLALRSSKLERMMVSVVDKNGYEERAWAFIARRPQPDLKWRKGAQAATLKLAADCGLPSAQLALLERLPTTECLLGVSACETSSSFRWDDRNVSVEALALSHRG